jgi:hypothetical protein
MNALVTVPEYPVSDLERMAGAVAKSNLFGIKTADQALALMLVAQAEGMHPATAARDYDIIQGRPAKKAEAMMRDFIRSGGSVKWAALTDDRVTATFAHPQGGEVEIDWDMKRAQAAGLGGKDMWKKYPRQMLRARVVSEGIRTVCPMATGGMYVPEEVRDFDDAPRVTNVRDITPKAAPTAEAKRQEPEHIIDPPAADRPVDRTNQAVPPPDGDFPPDWEDWRKIIVAKINRAGSPEQVATIQQVNAEALAACAKVLDDTVERMTALVDTKLAKLSEREKEAA